MSSRVVKRLAINGGDGEVVSSGVVEDDDEDVVIVEARSVAAGKDLVLRFSATTKFTMKSNPECNHTAVRGVLRP